MAAGESADFLPGPDQPPPLHFSLHAPQTHQHRQHVGGVCRRGHPSPHGVGSVHGDP